jgi:hypothetical protein
MPVNKNGRRVRRYRVRGMRERIFPSGARPPGNPFKFGLRNSLKEKIGA